MGRKERLWNRSSWLSWWGWSRDQICYCEDHGNERLWIFTIWKRCSPSCPNFSIQCSRKTTDIVCILWCNARYQRWYRSWDCRWRYPDRHISCKWSWWTAYQQNRFRNPYYAFTNRNRCTVPEWAFTAQEQRSGNEDVKDKTVSVKTAATFGKIIRYPRWCWG